MKIALVCDDLIQFGGAERVVMAFHEIWPEAPIYTSVASKRWLQVARDKNIDLRVSFMQRLPLVEKLNRYYSIFFLHILAFEHFDFNQYDLVLSSSSRYAHGIVTTPKTQHICYMHSPGRMFWESAKYFENERFGLLAPLKAFGNLFLSPFLSHIRIWDYTASKRVDHFLTNSKLSQQRILAYYKREATVIHPFFDSLPNTETSKVGEYFLVITRLPAWKRVDIAVKAFSELNLPLKIIGGGPDMNRLKNMAGPSIEFLGYASDETRNNLLKGCKALVQTQKEDFGIVPLEALAYGKPVIAYGAGGVLDVLEEGKTGMFYYEQTAQSLIKAVKNFDSSKFSAAVCKARANDFSKAVFVQTIKDFVNAIYLKAPKFL